MNVLDTANRLAEIGSFGDPAVDWYFQSDTPPDLPLMQSQHDGFVAALEAEGANVPHRKGEAGIRLKRVYARDPFITVKGGAIVFWMGAWIRRGEELAVTRTLTELGIPILRTVNGSGVMEGGSIAWLNKATCAPSAWAEG